MKKFLCILMALALALPMFGCGTTDSVPSGVEDGVLTVGMECAYAPYNWTQMDDSNGAVPISNVEGAYANGYDVLIAKRICQTYGWELEVMQIVWDMEREGYKDIHAGEMFKYAPAILHAARRLGSAKTEWSDYCSRSYRHSEVATLLRKLSFEGPNSYDEAGWVTKEIFDNIGIHM